MTTLRLPFRCGFSILTLLALPGLPSTAAIAAAQDEAPQAPATDQAVREFDDEIVVTARRREEDVLTVPLSITAFTDADIEARSITSISELDTFTPNLHFSATAGIGDETAMSTVFMRGLGQVNIQRINTDASVGLYVDGVYVARSMGSVFDLLDIERAEVLRGPQGTLFGKNTTGGAINLVTRRPGNQFVGRLTATAGEYDRRDLNASLSGPLAESLQASIVLMSARRDGFSRSLTTGQDFYDVDRQAGRARLAWQPTASLDLDLVSDFTRQRESGANQVLLDVSPTDFVDLYNRARAAAGQVTYTNEWLTGRFDRSYSDLPSHVDGDVYGTSLHATWTRRSTTLTSITAYRGYTFDTAGDADGAPLPFAHRTTEQAQDQLSQEIHLSGVGAGDRLHWLAGGLYFRERPRAGSVASAFGGFFETLESLPGAIISPPGVPPSFCDPGPPPPGVPCFGGAGNPLNSLFFIVDNVLDLNLTTESWAVFSESTYDVSDRVALTLGLRYSRDDKEMGFTSTFPDRVLRIDKADTWDAWTPRLSLSWQAAPRTMAYLTASRGFKSGGINQRLLNGDLDPFDPELVWSYEVGFKTELFDRRLRITESTFFSDYDDIQFSVLHQISGVPVAIINNAGKAEIWGFELELEARPATGLTLSAAIGHVDGEITELDEDADAPEGARPPKTPRWDLSAAGQYAWSAGKSSWITRVDYSWRDDVFNDFRNSPETVQEAYSLVNARLTWAPPSGRWDIALFATNLTDEQYLETILFSKEIGVAFGIAGRPREWGLTFQMRW